MSIIEIILIGIALSMDACAISVCMGLGNKNKSNIEGIYLCSSMAIFQGIMPLIGYYLGHFFDDKIEKFSPYISLALLSLIGISMIKDAFNKEEIIIKIKIKEILLVSLLTSIDALIVGITFSLFKTNIYLSILIISTITFILTIIANRIGSFFGKRYSKTPKIIGGLILIILGIITFLEKI